MFSFRHVFRGSVAHAISVLNWVFGHIPHTSYVSLKNLCSTQESKSCSWDRCDGELRNRMFSFGWTVSLTGLYIEEFSVIFSTFKCKWRNVSSQTRPLYTSCEVLPCWNIIAALSLQHWKLTEEQGSNSTSVWDVVQFNFICLCEVCLICETADYTEIKQKCQEECCSTLSLCEWMLSKCFIFTFFKYIF